MGPIVRNGVTFTLLVVRYIAVSRIDENSSEVSVLVGTSLDFLTSTNAVNQIVLGLEQGVNVPPEMFRSLEAIA